MSASPEPSQRKCDTWTCEEPATAHIQRVGYYCASCAEALRRAR